MGLDLTHFIPVKVNEKPDGYEVLDVQELAENPQYLAAFRGFLVDGDEADIKKLYFQELGYQRKGMSRKFYKDFRDGYYFDFAKVQSAYEYLEGDHLHTLEELQRNFKTSFMDNFIPGRSVFCVGY